MYRKILSSAKHHKVYSQVKTLLIVLIALFIYGTIGYSALKQVDLQTGFVLTVETFEFVHHPEPAVGTRIFQASLLLFGGVFMWFTIWTLLELTFKGQLSKYFREVIHLIRAGRSKDHVVVCGGGRVGSTVAKLLKEKGKQVVIIEKDHNVAAKLRREGFTVINEDASREESLREANVEKAKTLIAAMSSGEKNIILILTAKQINPKIEILARTEDAEHEKKLKSLGAKQVIMPEIAGAKELASFIR
ncbi:MAG: NAD-binding protein [Candidatus Micrarchaeota archaeon]|nr:NAD-binding protein [Candidatus Micrarchaeota archaeon]